MTQTRARCSECGKEFFFDYHMFGAAPKSTWTGYLCNDCAREENEQRRHQELQEAEERRFREREEAEDRRSREREEAEEQRYREREQAEERRFREQLDAEEDVQQMRGDYSQRDSVKHSKKEDRSRGLRSAYREWLASLPLLERQKYIDIKEGQISDFIFINLQTIEALSPDDQLRMLINNLERIREYRKQWDEYNVAVKQSENQTQILEMLYSTLGLGFVGFLILQMNSDIGAPSPLWGLIPVLGYLGVWVFALGALIKGHFIIAASSVGIPLLVHFFISRNSPKRKPNITLLVEATKISPTNNVISQEVSKGTTAPKNTLGEKNSNSPAQNLKIVKTKSASDFFKRSE